MNFFMRGIITIIVGFIFNILETWYFGWNMTAQSTAERFSDNISGLIMAVGLLMVFGYVLGSTMTVRVVKNHDSNERMRIKND